MLRRPRRDDLFTVVHDQFLTDTARYADIVLPATTMLEHADLVGSWGFSYLSWNEAAIDPVGESKSNAEVARLLAARLGFDEEVFRLDDHQLMELALRGLTCRCRRLTSADAPRRTASRASAHRRAPPSPSDATFAFSSDALRRPVCTRSPSTARRPGPRTTPAVTRCGSSPSNGTTRSTPPTGTCR